MGRRKIKLRPTEAEARNEKSKLRTRFILIVVAASLASGALLLDLLVLAGHLPATVLPPAVWNPSLVMETITCGVVGFITPFFFGGRVLIQGLLSLLVVSAIVLEGTYYCLRSPEYALTIIGMVALPVCSWFMGLWLGRGGEERRE